jgi:hypothetical protein
MTRKTIDTYNSKSVPVIKGAGGGKGGGGNVAPNSLFSTDILLLTNALGEGPLYRINPNGPQDIQIAESKIDDLVNLDGDGGENTENFQTATTPGTLTQDPLPFFGDRIVSPQQFGSQTVLKKGNVDGVPSSSITLQETSAAPWDALKFNFVINALFAGDDEGNVKAKSLTLLIELYDSDGIILFESKSITITGKSDTAYKFSVVINIANSNKSDTGYRFSVNKTSNESDNSKVEDNIAIIGWDEIENTSLSYPRTALIGYAIKAANEHTGGIPNFTSMVKGLIVKVPSNYNQPTVGGAIDWRQLEVGTSSYPYTTYGYYLQHSGTSTVLTDLEPELYVGTWDGSFVYSWTQNPVWIIYDLLTNKTYGLGIPEQNIDKYKFYQVAQYCDACDATTGKFIGVTGLADGSYRYKPRTLFTSNRQNQTGIPEGSQVKERRFISDLTISDTEKSIDLLNRISSTFRAVIIYSGGKISLAVDMPDEYPSMMFNEGTIKEGTLQISGGKESEIYTGVDATYIEPSNHFKRETVRVDSADHNDGSDFTNIDNILALDLFGVTRRSQAIRAAQYQLAASKYLKRSITFGASLDAINLSPGDVISVATRSTGLTYGYGGKVFSDTTSELVTNGDGASAAGWDTSGTSSVSVVSDTLRFTYSSGEILSQSFTTVIGKSYTLGWDAIAGTGTTYRVLLGSGVGNGSTYIGPTVAQGTGSGFITFTATLTTTVLSIQCYTSGYQDFDNLTVRLASTDVMLEHFTVPALTSSVFTANTYPIAMRILRQDSDKLDLYIVSNTNYEVISTGNTGSSADVVRVTATQQFNPITRTLQDLTNSFSGDDAPKAGDLWSLGEITNPQNYYSDLSAKLFKVTSISRDSKEEVITVSGLEYISNVYVDSDTFINYKPTPYIDVTSPFSTPPTPAFSLSYTKKVKTDGSVYADVNIRKSTEISGYTDQDLETEYFISSPFKYSTILSATNNPLTLTASNASSFENDTQPVVLQGKNGFVSDIGRIQLLCNSFVVEDGSNVVLTVEGFGQVFDENFNQHVLEVNDGLSFSGLKGADSVIIPVKENANTGGEFNFIGYNALATKVSRPITGYNKASDTITIVNTPSGTSELGNVLPSPPFYISINQLIDTNYYSNASFYLTGSTLRKVQEDSFDTGISPTTIELDVKPRTSSFIKLYVDGILKNTNQFTVNLNHSLSIKANVSYANDVLDTGYRVETEKYTVPAIEVADIVEVSFNNVFTISDTSYDPASPKYNAALTANSIFRVYMQSTPNFDMTNYRFINVSPNPVGVLANLVANTFTLDYSTDKYAGNFRLANNGIYTVHLNSDYEKLYLPDDATIREVPVGMISVKARNKNRLGRVSSFVESSVTVDSIPIKKVENIAIVESLYREQSGGVVIRVTCSFDHIVGQQVTDYEISYKIDSVEPIGVDDGGSPLTDYNTVKIPATGVDENGRLNFTINGVNRGLIAGSTTITLRVVALNKSIRGYRNTITKDIIGKSSAPQNINNFTGGQNNEQITLFWGYARINDELQDIDLKEVVIRIIPGEKAITLDNFLAGNELVTVSAGTARKSIPISTFGTFTYLVRTRDTSGNFSESVTGITITSSQPKRSTTVFAINEDNPTEAFTQLTNLNVTEDNYPSFASSNSGGLSYDYTSATDNANGSSSGWTVIGSSPTDLLATGDATYITQIRDFGTPVTGSIVVNIIGSQTIQDTYYDQKTNYLSGVSDNSNDSTILYDTSFGGIANVLGFANSAVTTGRYDSNNKTWMTGPSNGNVWAIFNLGQFVDDTANANSYALIAGLINANAIALGETYHANGDVQLNGSGFPSNSLPNTTSGASYSLVDLRQYSDTGPTNTYQGVLNGIQAQTSVRTSTAATVYHPNGNVDVTTFAGIGGGDGFSPYESGTKTFRWMQIKFQVNNSLPDDYDFTLDKFRITIDKEQTIVTNTVAYTNSPTTVDLTSSSFLSRPAITYAVLDQIDAEANPAIAITTAASNTSLSFKLVSSNGTGPYLANSSANVMITAIGV